MTRNILGSAGGLCLIVWGCLALLLSGCGTTGKSEFDTVAGHLESGGSYYRISDNRELFDLCGKTFRVFESSLYKGNDFAANEKKMLVCALYELIFRRLGVAECVWSGSSSVRIPDALEKTYRNRSFYLLPDNAAGLLWQLPGKKNRPLLKELRELPADTIFAGDFFLDLRSLKKALVQSKILPSDAEGFCRVFFKTELEELFNGISGEWGIAVFPDDGKSDKLDLVVTLPDRKRRVFTALSEFVKKIPGSKTGDNSVSLFLPDMGIEVSCFSTDDSLTIFSSEQAKQKFLFSNSKLASQPDFKRLSTGMPDNGVAVFYSAATPAETRQISLPAAWGGGSVDVSEFDRPALTVVRSEKNGISVVSHSGFDIPAGNVADLLLMPMLVLAEQWEFVTSLMPAAAPEKKKTAAEPRNPGSENPAFYSACRDNMKQIAEALKKYAQKHKDYPAEMNLEGIRPLLSGKLIDRKFLVCPATGDKSFAGENVPDVFDCSYIYLGKWNKNAHAKLPLVIERPGNHCDHFHVLFNDGTIEFLKLENCTGIKRVAGFLHTKYKYSEDEFRSLINRAALLDAETEVR